MGFDDPFRGSAQSRGPRVSPSRAAALEISIGNGIEPFPYGNASVLDLNERSVHLPGVYYQFVRSAAMPVATLRRHRRLQPLETPIRCPIVSTCHPRTCGSLPRRWNSSCLENSDSTSTQ